MKIFSKKWKSSTKPRKQRKYLFNAPLHTKQCFLNSHLSKELREKYNTRKARVSTGDKVKIMRGSSKGKQGKVSRVDTKNLAVYVEGFETKKKDGSKAAMPFKASNIMILELNLKDPRRLKNTKPEKPVKKKKAAEKMPKEQQPETKKPKEEKKKVDSNGKVSS
ncbi:MAG TPA: 50S ribosomal protein L24 [Candidatus Woesearchaeota archaeon]|nr:50S ribosomal protein L24 [Candidatus Woesearchaeota archaeon]